MNFTLATLALTATYWFWAIVVLVCALAGIFFYYRRTMPPIRGKVKGPLVALRIIAALALFLALAEALWSAIRVESESLGLWVLYDRSASMAEKDGVSDDRLQRASDYLKDRLDSRFGDRARIVTTYFDDHLLDREKELPDSLGAATAIGDVLDELHRRPIEIDPPRVTVLLSDGASNRGAEPAPAASRLGYPVVTIGFGKPGVAQARVAQIEAPEAVFTGKSFELTADLQGGTTGGNATVRLSSRGKTLDQKTADLPGAGQRLPLTLSGQLNDPGMHDLRVDVLGADGQVIPASGKTVFVQALKGRLRVFLAAFDLNWEYGALKRLLSRQDRVELIEYIPGTPGLGAAPTGSEWGNFDIVILLYPSRNELEDFWAPHTEAMSQPARGTVVVLNERFASGTQTAPPPFEFVSRSLGYPRGEFLSDPDATRQNHPLVRLHPTNTWEDTRTQWTSRPPWAGMVAFDSLPKDADVLVRARTSSGHDVPIVWTRPLRRGRSLVIAGSPMWRWTLENAAQGLAAAEYDAFWSNALRWLTLTDDADRLAVRSDLDVYHTGEPITLDGLVYDEAYRFIDRAEVTARVWPEDGKDTIRLVLNPGAGDRFRGHVSALPPGNYRYDGTAAVEGQSLKLSGGMFRIEPYGLEQRFSALDETTLRAIAQESGGRYYSEHDDPQFLDSLDFTPVTHERNVEVNLGNHWLVLSIFVAALSVEWFIRRRKQLL